MHASSLENMWRCYRAYVQYGPLERQAETHVLEIGSQDVNGSYRRIFARAPYRYIGADMEPGPGVDLVLADPYKLPIADASVDIIVSGQAFEHSEYFWRVFDEMARVLKHDGLIFLIVPSTGPIHRYPVDCYRFYPDAFSALAKLAKCRLLEVWRDDRGPWRDLVGVFQHEAAVPIAPLQFWRPLPPESWQGAMRSDAEEATRGRVERTEVLERLHQALAPRLYLEIGVGRGTSLALAKGPAIAVDPAPDLSAELPMSQRLHAVTSDDFFAYQADGVSPDFAFIDGMPLVEFALRDFINIERRATPGCIVVIGNVFPNHVRQARRERETEAWSGDVWRIAELLRERRPDLFTLAIDCSPSGLLLIAGLDPKNTALTDGYNGAMRRMTPTDPPPEILERRGAIDPGDRRLQAVFDALAAARARGAGPAETVNSARAALAAPPPASPPPPSLPAPRDFKKKWWKQLLSPSASGRPKASLVVISYNMARELPRTVQSLSPALQRGVAAEDYEIIVVDNGSTRPFDAGALTRLAPNLVLANVKEATASPVKAVNLGLSIARGDLVGVAIDGARMASPGLIAKAIGAAALHPKPVVGTIAFHLGPKAQPISIKEGYDQAVEDELLARCGWEDDAYRLFGVSALAVSSGSGWFETPMESNAFFCTSAHWRELGGWDERFVSPGGGIVNLDTWRRAIESPGAQLIMLLGEATFHQVHGGVATNSLGPPIADFFAEYERIRGVRFERPSGQALYFGSLPETAKPSFKASLDRL